MPYPTRATERSGRWVRSESDGSYDAETRSPFCSRPAALYLPRIEGGEVKSHPLSTDSIGGRRTRRRKKKRTMAAAALLRSVARKMARAPPARPLLERGIHGAAPGPGLSSPTPIRPPTTTTPSPASKQVIGQRCSLISYLFL